MEELLKELGFKLKSHIFYHCWDKSYKTKLGKIIISIDLEEKIKNEQIAILWEGEFSLKTCVATEKNIRKWDDYFTKMTKL